MYGWVHRGPKYTRLYLEITLRNGCPMFIARQLPNDQLEEYPALYGWTLDRMTEDLAKRVSERLE